MGDLLTADHTFLNERLARHYGITSVLGPQFRRVTLDDPRRMGLLGKGAMLLRTSYGDRTSPVLRGAWVLGKLMGTPPTPPPPDVDTDLSQPKGRGAQDAAGAARKSSQQAGVPAVPRRDRSDRSRAGELRCHRPMARRRSGSQGPDRRQHGAAERAGGGWPGPAAPGAVRRQGSVRAGAHRKADDVRVGERASVLRYAPGSRGGSPGRGTELPAVGDRVRHRDERCLPHAGGRLRRGSGAKKD